MTNQITIMMTKVKETAVPIFLIWSYKNFDVFIKIYCLLSFLFKFLQDAKLWGNYRRDTN